MCWPTWAGGRWTAAAVRLNRGAGAGWTMPATSVKAAMAGARRIALRVHTASVEDGLAPIGLSLGVVSAQPGESLSQVLVRADAALYEAKRQGRRRAVLAVGESERPVFAASEPLGLDPLPAPVPSAAR